MSRHPASPVGSGGLAFAEALEAASKAPSVSEPCPPVCDFCEGEGKAYEWIPTPTGVVDKLVDCPRCNGTGGSSPTAVAEARKAASLREGAL